MCVRKLFELNHVQANLLLFIHKHGMRNRRRNIVIERLKKSKKFRSMTKRFTGIHESKIKLMSMAMDMNGLCVYIRDISDTVSNSSVTARHDRSSIITLTNTVTYIYIYVSESCHDVREYGLGIELITFGERNEPLVCCHCEHTSRPDTDLLTSFVSSAIKVYIS